MINLKCKNIAWVLPRPKKDSYKGGMPLYAEERLIRLARNILRDRNAKVLSLFCGMCKIGYRVDIRPLVKPKLCCDIHELSRHLKKRKESFDIILADPPYSNKESKDVYGTPKLKYSKWTKEADVFLRPGGLFIIYHKLMMPNPNPKTYDVVKRVFIGIRTNHPPRVATFYHKHCNPFSKSTREKFKLIDI